MVKLVLDNAGDFKRSIDGISVLIDEAEFVISQNGLGLKATDPSQISMVDFAVPAKSFKKFEVEGTAKIGIDLDYFGQIMSRAKPTDELTLELDEQNSRLKVLLKGASDRNFVVPLIDVSSSELPTPKIEFDAEVKLHSGLLLDGLKDASLISTHIVLAVKDDAFWLKANSSKGELNHKTAKSASGVLDLKSKKDCQAMFPLDFLSDMLKASSSETILDVSLKANAPVRLSYAVGPASLTYFLAPRIESD